jgi:RimJ/RimL family protein N-acetyltransferase
LRADRAGIPAPLGVRNLVIAATAELAVEDMSALTSPIVSTPRTLRQTHPQPLSLRLWDIDWRPLFPQKLDEGVMVEWATFDAALPFIRENYGEIFGPEESAFLSEAPTEAKRRFCAEMDVFLFRAEGRTVGLHLAHPSDWSTYYLRSAAFVKEYRARGLMQAFAERFWPVLEQAGVARLEVEVNSSNLPSIALMTKVGFSVTSMTTSERWGALVRLTKFLRPECKDVFRRQFCCMPSRTTDFDPKRDRS